MKVGSVVEVISTEGSEKFLALGEVYSVTHVLEKGEKELWTVSLLGHKKDWFRQSLFKVCDDPEKVQGHLRAREALHRIVHDNPAYLKGNAYEYYKDTLELLVPFWGEV